MITLAPLLLTHHAASRNAFISASLVPPSSRSTPLVSPPPGGHAPPAGPETPSR